MDREAWIKRRDALRAGRGASVPESSSTAPGAVLPPPPVVRPPVPPPPVVMTRAEAERVKRAQAAASVAEKMFTGCPPEVRFLAFQALFMGCVTRMGANVER